MGKMGSSTQQTGNTAGGLSNNSAKSGVYQPLRSSNTATLPQTSNTYFSQSFTSGTAAKPVSPNPFDLANKYLNPSASVSSQGGAIQSGRLSGYNDTNQQGMSTATSSSFSQGLSSNYQNQAIGARPSQQHTLSFSPTQLSPNAATNVATNQSGPAPTFNPSQPVGTQEDHSQPRTFQQPASASTTDQTNPKPQTPSSPQQQSNQSQPSPNPRAPPVPTPSTLHTAQDYSSWSGHNSSIDPKYVGELESNIGKVRLENNNLVSRMQQIEHRAVAAEQQLGVYQSQVQQLQKELGDQTALKSQISQLEFQLEAKTREVAALHEGSIQIRNQLFTQTFDKFAFESSTRECSALREQIKAMTSTLDNLRTQFNDFIGVVGLKPQEVHAREEQLQQLNVRNQELERQLQSKSEELSNARREVESLRDDRSKAPVNPAMWRSQNTEETTDVNILRRKFESTKKELEYLKRQNQELKTQMETQSQQRTASMFTSGYHEGERSSLKPNFTIRRDTGGNKELQMKDLEVA